MLTRNGKAGVNFLFILVFIVCIVIWWRFKDFKTAFIVFLVYAAIRIIANFMKKERREEYYE